MDFEQTIGKDFTTKEELTKEGLKLEATYEGKYGKASFTYEVGVVEMLKELAKKTDNKIDDALVEMVEKALE